MQTRQREILELVINEYIKTATPVGSEVLVEKYKLDFSPATVRNELLELTENKYLFQPHASAGRVPTDKGYRFFVDRLLKENLTLVENDKKFLQQIKKKVRELQKEKEKHRIVKEVAKTISFYSHSIGICGFIEEEEFYSTGVSYLLKEPEFSNVSEFFDCLEIFDSLEQEIIKIIDKVNNGINVFIGKEGGGRKFDDFSIILSRYKTGKNDSIFGVLGFKRMNYSKNLALINSVKEIISKEFNL